MNVLCFFSLSCAPASPLLPPASPSLNQILLYSVKLYRQGDIQKKTQCEVNKVNE